MLATDLPVFWNFLPTWVKPTTLRRGIVPLVEVLVEALPLVPFGSASRQAWRDACVATASNGHHREVAALEALASRAEDLGFFHLAEAILDDAVRFADGYIIDWPLAQHSRESWAITLWAMDSDWRVANAASRVGVSPAAFDF